MNKRQKKKALAKWKLRFVSTVTRQIRSDRFAYEIHMKDFVSREKSESVYFGRYDLHRIPLPTFDEWRSHLDLIHSVRMAQLQTKVTLILPPDKEETVVGYDIENADVWNNGVLRLTKPPKVLMRVLKNGVWNEI